MWSKASFSEVHSFLCVYYAFKKESQAPLSFRYLKASPFIFFPLKPLTEAYLELFWLLNFSFCWHCLILIAVEKNYRFIHHFSYFPLFPPAWWAVFSITDHRFCHDDFIFLEDASQQFTFKGISLAFWSIVLLFQVLWSSQKAPELHGDKTESMNIGFHCPNKAPYYCGEGEFQVNCLKKKILVLQSSKKIPL